MCRILGLLAQRETAIPAVLRWNPCQQLVSLLSAINIEVVMGAAETLSSIAKCAEGAQAIADAKVFDCFAKLLETPDEKVQKWPREIMGELVSHDTTARAATGAIVSLLRSRNITVTKRAANVVDHIITFPLGAQALVAGNILDAVAPLLDDSQMREWTCEMLKILADEPATMAVVSAHLVVLCRHENSEVVESAAKALSSISTSPGGARAAMDANVLDYVHTLLQLPSTGVRKWTCDMLRELVRHPTTAEAAVGHIASLLRSQHPKVVENAARILCQSTGSSEGAQAILDTNVLQCVPDLLESPAAGVRKWTWSLLDESAGHDITMRAAVEQMVSLIRGDDVRLVQGAAHRLWQTSKSSAGAQAAVDANVFEYLPVLAESRNALIQRWTWNLLEELVRRESTTSAAICEIVSLCRIPTVTKRATDTLYRILTDQPSMVKLALEQLIFLLRHDNSDVVESAAKLLDSIAASPSMTKFVLEQLIVLLRHDNSDVVEGAVKLLDSIATSPEGAQAVVDAHLLDCVVELLDSPNTGVKVWTCELLAKAACHQATRDRVLRVKPCAQLVSLLRDQDPVVVERSAKALSWIAKVEAGVQSAVDAKVLDYVEELLESPNAMVCLWTCKILGELARHEAIVPAILAVEPCPQLVSVMQTFDFISNCVLVRTAALSALARISESPDGAAAVAATQLMVYPSELTDHEVQIIAKNLSGSTHDSNSNT
ncbi:armadillo-type protein [Mycena latifolia]|nr:armadillo-type protein [Mycena latifolia]